MSDPIVTNPTGAYGLPTDLGELPNTQNREGWTSESSVWGRAKFAGRTYDHFNILSNGQTVFGDGTYPPSIHGASAQPFRDGIPTRNGEAAVDCHVATSTVNLSSQRMFVVGFVPTVTEDVTIASSIVVTAAGATPTLARYGVYTMDSGLTTATLAASTANNTALLSTTGQRRQALTTTFSKVRGTPILLAVLCVTAASLPSILCRAATAATFGLIGTAGTQFHWLAGHIDGQADLPASFALNSMIATAGNYPLLMALDRA